MKNIENKLLLFMIMFISIVSIVGFAFTKDNTYSEIENRYLSELTLETIDDYMSDHLILRNELISFKNKFKNRIGNTLINGVYVGDDDYLIPEFKTSEKKDAIIRIINDFVSKNNNVDVMLVPDSYEINNDKIRNKLDISEIDDINYFYRLLNSNNIDVYSSIKQENDKYNNQYYRTDHHWSGYGAYTAYKKYMSIKNMKYLDIEDFDVEEIDNFNGTSSSLAIGLSKPEKMYIFNKNNDLDVEYVYENIKTNSLYNRDYLDTKDKYATFLDNNHALIKITNNDIDTERSIIIIKNSYANSFVPFIVNNYTNVYVVDLRYFKESTTDFIKENKIDDILILYNLNNLYSDLSIAYLK